MILITESEIDNYLVNSFEDYGVEICCKTDCFGGEKDYALCTIEKLLGLIQRKNKDDKNIIIYLKNLFSLSRKDSTEYKDFLDIMHENSTNIEVVERCEKALSEYKSQPLSFEEKRVLKSLVESNLGEYGFKGEYESCCYSAMSVLLKCLYCILRRNIKITSISEIELVVDVYDKLLEIKIYEGKVKKDEDAPIYVKWESTNKINNIYMLYKTKYIGLDKSSILDLVAADVIEEDYYLNDERFTIAPSILVKQYCGIIEHEVNEIIRLKYFKHKHMDHFMWGRMKNYVKRKHIDLGCNYALYETLEKLQGLRNAAAHGEVITSDEYKEFNEYRLGLFEAISIKKLELSGGKINPTIDEIQKYMSY